MTKKCKSPKTRVIVFTILVFNVLGSRRQKNLTLREIHQNLILSRDSSESYSLARLIRILFFREIHQNLILSRDSSESYNPNDITRIIMDIDAITHQVEHLNLDPRLPTDAERRMLEYCRILPPPFDNIGPVLQAHKAVIAGSAVVHALLPALNVNPNDIDIFCPEDSVLPLQAALLSTKYWQRQWFPTDTYTWFVDGVVSHAQVYRASEGRINIISLFQVKTADEVMQKIQETFDLDGCAVCYDGVRIHMNPHMKNEDFANGLWTYNLAGLVHAMKMVQHIKWQPELDADSSTGWARKLIVYFARIRERIQKYSLRGIRLVNGLEILSMLVKNYQ